MIGQRGKPTRPLPCQTAFARRLKATTLHKETGLLLPPVRLREPADLRGNVSVLKDHNGTQPGGFSTQLGGFSSYPGVTVGVL